MLELSISDPNLGHSRGQKTHCMAWPVGGGGVHVCNFVCACLDVSVSRCVHVRTAVCVLDSVC